MVASMSSTTELRMPVKDELLPMETEGSEQMLKELSTNPDRVEQFVQFLRVLGDPTRLRLLGMLQGGESNVTSLCEQLSLPQPTVSHHLGLLRQAKLVRNRRSGKQVFYSLNSSVVDNLDAPGGIRVATNGVELHLSTLDGPGITRPANDHVRAQPVIETVRARQEVAAP